MRGTKTKLLCLTAHKPRQASVLKETMAKWQTDKTHTPHTQRELNRQLMSPHFNPHIMTRASRSLLGLGHVTMQRSLEAKAHDGGRGKWGGGVHPIFACVRKKSKEASNNLNSTLRTTIVGPAKTNIFKELFKGVGQRIGSGDTNHSAENSWQALSGPSMATFSRKAPLFKFWKRKKIIKQGYRRMVNRNFTWLFFFLQHWEFQIFELFWEWRGEISF